MMMMMTETNREPFLFFFVLTGNCCRRRYLTTILLFAVFTSYFSHLISSLINQRLVVLSLTFTKDQIFNLITHGHLFGL